MSSSRSARSWLVSAFHQQYWLALFCSASRVALLSLLTCRRLNLSCFVPHIESPCSLLTTPRLLLLVVELSLAALSIPLHWIWIRILRTSSCKLLSFCSCFIHPSFEYFQLFLIAFSSLSLLLLSVILLFSFSPQCLKVVPNLRTLSPQGTCTVHTTYI